MFPVLHLGNSGRASKKSSHHACLARAQATTRCTDMQNILSRNNGSKLGSGGPALTGTGRRGSKSGRGQAQLLAQVPPAVHIHGRGTHRYKGLAKGLERPRIWVSGVLEPIPHQY